MNTHKAHTGSHEIPFLERDNDAYKSKEKLPGATVCKQCGAVYQNGRWQWINAPAEAHQDTCPACHRVQDNYPAGFVTLDGPFFDANRGEIGHLIEHHAHQQRAEHPLKRIIAMENQGAAMLITTTDTHLARGIGEAVRHAYHGKLKINHTPGESLVRVHWSR